MTKRARPGQPRRDRTVDALLALVEAVLDDVFLDDDAQDRYETVARGGPEAGVKAVETVSIRSLALSDHGAVRLAMRPGSPEITVAITHPRFSATIAALYDPHTAMMTEARIVGIEGDQKKARGCADKWFEELLARSFDDVDETMDDALADFELDDVSPFDGES